MDIPDLETLKAAARKIVHRAVRAGTVSSLTPRIVRQEVESQFSLETGSLDVPEYKQPLKLVITAAVEEDVSGSESEGSSKGLSRLSRKRKLDEGISAEKKSEQTKGVKGVQKPKSIAKADGKEEENPKAIKKRQKKDSKEYKSAEHVPTSDVEMDEPTAPSKSRPKESKLKKSEPKEQNKAEDKKPASSPKKRRKTISSNSKVDEDDVKPKLPAKQRPSATPKAASSKVEDKSDSELSILFDEPPKPKGKAKAKEKSMAAKKTSAKGSANLTKDEETIKRLKSLVSACGVRKIWSKVFEGVDSPKAQIKKVREILAELGMSGRMSMEQAKAIKEKRELAKELEEVQQFEEAVVGRSSRSSKPAANIKNESEPEEDEDESSEWDEDVAPRRVRPSVCVPDSTIQSNARKSIMAFLADQSDSD